MLFSRGKHCIYQFKNRKHFFFHVIKNIYLVFIYPSGGRCHIPDGGKAEARIAQQSTDQGTAPYPLPCTHVQVVSLPPLPYEVLALAMPLA